MTCLKAVTPVRGVCAIALVLLITCHTHAIVRTFDNGGGDSDWLNPLNWDPDGTVQPGDEVIINSGVPATTNFIELQDGASITMSGPTAGASLASMILGRFGTGFINVENGADFASTVGGIDVGALGLDSAFIDVRGAGTTWTLTNTTLKVGQHPNTSQAGKGTLRITDQAVVTSNRSIDFGTRGAHEGVLTLTEATLSTTSHMSIGQISPGVATVTGESTLEATGSLFVGAGDGATGDLTINDSTLNVGPTTIGGSSVGVINASNGADLNVTGTLSLGERTLGAIGDGTLNLDGASSTLDASSFVIVGRQDMGAVDITGGADVVTGNQLIVGQTTTADGFVGVSGAGSTWTSNSGKTTVGSQGLGQLFVDFGAHFSAPEINLGQFASGDGTLSVGFDDATVDTDTIHVGGTEFGAGGVGALSIDDGGIVNVTGATTVWDQGEIGMSGGTLNTQTLDLTAPGASFVWLGGTLVAETVEGDLTNGTLTDSTGGTLSPGASPGVTTVNGNYDQLFGSLAIELAGSGGAPGTDFDQVVVTGDASLAGDIDVSLLGGFEPTLGESFTVLTATNVTGSLNLASAPTFNGMTLDVTVGPTSVVLSVVAASLPGDADGDGDVDLSDFNILAANFGLGPNAPGGFSIGDFDVDGDVDLQDFNLLAANFGIGTESVGSLPEPGALVVVLLSALTAGRGRRDFA